MSPTSYLTAPPRGGRPTIPAAASVDNSRSLLLVALDRAGVADVRLGGIGAGPALGPALAEEVPTLVELDLDVVQAGVGLRGRIALAVELVLLVDQGVDAGDHLVVDH